MRSYLCVDCLTTIDDDDVEAGAMYTGPRCQICREDYWDECCFECGATPDEIHKDECKFKFRLHGGNDAHN